MNIPVSWYTAFKEFLVLRPLGVAIGPASAWYFVSWMSPAFETAYHAIQSVQTVLG